MTDDGPQRWTVAVPGEGETTVLLQRSQAPLADAVFAMAHGAGGHMEHGTMGRLAEAFLDAGLDVARFNFLYRERRRGGPHSMPKLQACCAAVADAVRQRRSPRFLVVGGQSMGGRCASMMAADGFPCDGLVLLAYPLHPAGRPDRLRRDHLARIRVPALCLNGTRDRLCSQDLMDQVVAGLPASFTMHWLAEADHGYKVPKSSGRTQDQVFAEIDQAARAWALATLR